MIKKYKKLFNIVKYWFKMSKKMAFLIIKLIMNS